MTAKNDITGDTIRTKGPSKAYAENWDRIFGKKPKTKNDKKVDNNSLKNIK